MDDHSKEPAEPALSRRFPEARFVRNPSRLLLACSRNLGAKMSSGTYLFFLDDDNVIAPDTISLLVSTLSKSDRIAVASPVAYFLDRPSDVWTSYISRTKFPGFYRLHTDVPPFEAPTFSFHNAFMVKRRVFEDLDGFDCLELPIRFSEVDFAYRVERAGFSSVVNPKAKDWHDLGWSLTHVDSTRAYYTERNRIVIIKRYYKPHDLTFYVLCILPFIGAYYLLHHPLSSSDSRVQTAANFVKGTVDGLMFRED